MTNSVVYRYKRFAKEENATAVCVSQKVLDGDRDYDPTPIMFSNPMSWVYPSGSVPITCLTATEARALGEAFIRAADLVVEALDGRCRCGEPIPTEEAECVMCSIETRKREHAERRSIMKVVRSK